METIAIIKRNTYYDSVALMAISGKIAAMPGVLDAVAAMATPMNKELLAKVEMLTDEIAKCGANDLVIAVKAADKQLCEETAKLAEEMLTQKQTVQNKPAGRAPTTISSAVKLAPETNIAIISVPGEYAAREAKQALKNGLHVMLFSDNVSLQDEKELKEMAHAKGLLLMGPDCGTAIVNNVGLCFANKVRPGNIGVIGASGTGLQEVTVLIDRFGGGISQALGTGGRDLSEEIGGIMMLDGLSALSRDEATKVIVIVSKPPAKTVADKILAHVQSIAKPVVVCFINGNAAQIEAAGAYAGLSLEDTARKAVLLASKNTIFVPEQAPAGLPAGITEIKSQLNSNQKYIRGLFCGGTLCEEALHIVKDKVGAVFSNIAKQPEYQLSDIHRSIRHTFIDLGDDAFTLGKPHPMIEPGLRLERLIQEAQDPEVSVILLDVVLGYGSHPDPAGVLLPALEKARQLARENGRDLTFIAYVCGTDGDKQNYREQKSKLAQAGVIPASSNAEAARLAAALIV